MTVEEVRAELESRVMRLSEQQKRLLIWMLEHQPRSGIVPLFYNADRITRSDFIPRDVRWSSENFLGHSPTADESSSLSRALGKLEERKLITLKRDRGKKRLTTHLLFTKIGRFVAEGLENGYTINPSAAQERQLFEGRLHNLSSINLGLLLLKRELARIENVLEQKVDNYASFNIIDASGEIAETRGDVETCRFELRSAIQEIEETKAERERRFNSLLLDLAQLEN